MSSITPQPELAFCIGDILKREGNTVEWLNFWRHSKPLTDIMPLHIARGNHEGNSDAAEKIYKEQTAISDSNFYYSFIHKNCAFVILDSYEKEHEGTFGDTQMSWLTSTLKYFENSVHIEYIFLFFHHPLFPQGKHRNEKFGNAEKVHTTFQSHKKIKAVFVGHDHMYNKFTKDNIVYITTGGAGASLYKGHGGDYHHFVKVTFYEESSRINIKTIGIFNEIVENFDL